MSTMLAVVGVFQKGERNFLTEDEFAVFVILKSSGMCQENWVLILTYPVGKQ